MLFHTEGDKAGQTPFTKLATFYIEKFPRPSSARPPTPTRTARPVRRLPSEWMWPPQSLLSSRVRNTPNSSKSSRSSVFFVSSRRLTQRRQSSSSSFC